MTAADKPSFVRAFNRLSVSLPLPQHLATDPEVKRGQMAAYFDALSDLPLDAVVSAVWKLQRRGSGYFPSTQEWYREADDLAYNTLLEQQQKALPPATYDGSEHSRAKSARERMLSDLRATPDRNHWDFGKLADLLESSIPCRDPERNPYAPWCDDCGDSGWLKRVCRDGERCEAHVGEDPEWGEHDHVSRCSCIAMNPKIQQRQAARRRVK